jgi:hypothetical protein
LWLPVTIHAGLAQALGQACRQFRAGQAAVAADDDLAFALRQRCHAKGLADLPRDAGVERAAEHASDVISLEYRFRERDHCYTLMGGESARIGMPQSLGKRADIVMASRRLGNAARSCARDG